MNKLEQMSTDTRYIKKNLNIEIKNSKEKKLPYVPTEEEIDFIKRYGSRGI